MTTDTARMPDPGVLQLRDYTSESLHVLELSGECDLASEAALALSLDNALATHPATLVIDLTAVTYCDATSVGLLLAAASQVAVALVAPSGPAARVLDLLAPQEILPRFPNVAAAITALTTSTIATTGSLSADPIERDGSGVANSGQHPDELAERETQRLAAVRRYGILDTPPDSAIDRIAALAARLFDVPIAIVSIIDEDRLWFMSHPGTNVTQVGRGSGLHVAAVSGHQLFVLANAMLDPRRPSGPQTLGDVPLRFWAGAPLTTGDGFKLGVLYVLGDVPRRFDARESETLQELASLVMDTLELRLVTRRALDLEAAARAAEQDRRRIAEALARTLQESLLPPHLPQIPGVDIAARYLPAAGGTEVVGDFYDVFQSGVDTWGVAMGDVCGSGVEAAKITALARHTLRAAAVRDSAPSRILTTLNQALLSRSRERANSADAERFLTAAYGTLREDAAGISIVLCSAGHMPALLRRADGTVTTIGDAGTILGVLPDADLGLRDSLLRLDPGDQLLLYTDGVTEARRDHEFYGEARLRRLLENAAGLDAGTLAFRIEADVLAFSGGELRDDTAVLVVGVPVGQG